MVPSLFAVKGIFEKEFEPMLLLNIEACAVCFGGDIAAQSFAAFHPTLSFIIVTGTDL